MVKGSGRWDGLSRRLPKVLDGIYERGHDMHLAECDRRRGDAAEVILGLQDESVGM